MHLLSKLPELQRARFVVRTNRFVAKVEFEGKTIDVHVPSTGRMQELLFDGATVYLEQSTNPNRKTKYGLRLCEHNGILIDLYAAKANAHFQRILQTHSLENAIFSPKNSKIKGEWTHGAHKFDFYLEINNKRAVIEVKSVNLVIDGTAMFPDAPTSRGAKHLDALGRLQSEGYECYAVFLVMREDAREFTFNLEKDPLFYLSAVEAAKNGVRFLCLQIRAAEDAIYYQGELPINWEK